MAEIDHARLRREALRWLILLTLNNARPIGAYEGLVLTVAQSEYPDATALELRREMDYLHDRELKLDSNQRGRWHAELSRFGVGIVSTVTCSPALPGPRSIGKLAKSTISRLPLTSRRSSRPAGREPRDARRADRGTTSPRSGRSAICPAVPPCTAWPKLSGVCRPSRQHRAADHPGAGWRQQDARSEALTALIH
jgi:hypothetical protein